MTKLKPFLFAGVDKSFSEFDAFINSLPLPTEELSGNFYHMATSISRVAMKNYVTLRHAFDDDCQELLAWSCRNLLELDVFMKYVLISRANAEEVAGHRLIDGLEIAEYLRDYELKTDPQLTASSFDALVAEMKQQMDAEGVVQSRHLSTRQLAKVVNMIDDYDSLNKLCSKLVHPTVWAILSEDIGSDRFPDARDLFYGCGAHYFLEIYVTIKKHHEQYGMNHRLPPAAVSGTP